jgi:hypothetical protein
MLNNLDCFLVCLCAVVMAGLAYYGAFQLGLRVAAQAAGGEV